METVTLELIHKDLEFLKSELIGIKERMEDADSIMTEDDCEALQEYNLEKSGGKLTAHEEIKKELGL
ncbi:MAG: hypothetical protein GIS02_03140 [Methanosarcinales archaeon]|uniref:Uncharacterized protein n=1 Tax=Candidatus Ethanoperedens thermophilum TaxID=2766897 RepID=A0A848D9F7_9EURY|nr:hypothetical protein [Candidatus Ethanoperedens thermophilum]